MENVLGVVHKASVHPTKPVPHILVFVPGPFRAPHQTLSQHVPVVFLSAATAPTTAGCRLQPVVLAGCGQAGSSISISSSSSRSGNSGGNDNSGGRQAGT